MLVLTRKSEEAVVIGDSRNFERLLEVRVLEIRGRSVKLGFEAIADLAVHRREVWERIQAGGQLGRSTGGAPVPVGLTRSPSLLEGASGEWELKRGKNEPYQ